MVLAVLPEGKGKAKVIQKIWCLVYAMLDNILQIHMSACAYLSCMLQLLEVQTCLGDIAHLHHIFVFMTLARVI